MLCNPMLDWNSQEPVDTDRSMSGKWHKKIPSLQLTVFSQFEYEPSDNNS